MKRKPDFENFLKVLHREVPDRPTLFEFFLNQDLYRILTGVETPQDEVARTQNMIDAFAVAGYDCIPLLVPHFSFQSNRREAAKTVSINEGAMIVEEEDFDNYHWPEFKREDFDILKRYRVPEGMKFLIYTPNGLLENTITLMGYDNLCVKLFDDPELVRRVVDKVGETLLAYYDWALDYDCFGGAICNDDWGFNTMPMLDPASMRKYIVPWTVKFVELIHSKGLPAIQHSCGNHYNCGLIDDIINVCKFEAHHSFEDKILPIEKAYPAYHQRIALLGGIDVNFICTSKPEEISKRCRAMLDMVEAEGGYALGSGNSIPSYVPPENYFAMISAALER